MKPGDEFDPKVDADVPRKEKIQQLLDEKKNQVGSFNRNIKYSFYLFFGQWTSNYNL